MTNCWGEAPSVKTFGTLLTEISHPWGPDDIATFREHLVKRGAITDTGKRNYPGRWVHHEWSPSPDVIEAVASAPNVNIDPECFAEYRLAQVRALLDWRMPNLDTTRTTEERRELRQAKLDKALAAWDALGLSQETVERAEQAIADFERDVGP